MTTINRDLLTYVNDVMSALADVKSGEVSYGEYHLGPVPVLFDGDHTGWQIVEDDTGFELESVEA